MPRLQPAALLGGGSSGRWLFRLVCLHDSTPECVCQHYGVRFGELHKALRSATVQFAQAAQDRARSPARAARQQDASQAATRQPGSNPPARQQPASPAATRQPGSNPPAQQQPASPAAARQPSSSPPAKQQPDSPAAGRQPGSYVIYAPARAGAPAPRRSNVPACACASAQVLRTRPWAMRVLKRERWVGL